MARKNITPEEETPKTTAPEKNTAADMGEVTPHDRPPDSEASEPDSSEGSLGSTVSEEGSVSTEEDTAPEGTQEDVPVEGSVGSLDMSEAGSAPAEEMSPEDVAAVGSREMSAAVESVLNAPADTPPEDASEGVDDVVNMTPGAIPELHETESEAEVYSVDLSETPENSSQVETSVPDAEESDWGFGEPKQETQEEPPAPPEPPVPPKVPKAAGKSDRQLFYELKFNELDRGLTPEERQEWNSIYAS